MKKNNRFRFIDVIVLVLFTVLCILLFNYRKKVNNGISKYRKTTIARTTYCNKNIRSSMHTLHYEFVYKDVTYTGTTQIDKDKRGEICKDVKFLVHFDSTNPVYNKILLDSLIK